MLEEITEVVTQTKICSKCNNEKTLDNYFKGKGKFNVRSVCKICVKEFYLPDIEKRREAVRNWGLKNKDYIAKRNRERHQRMKSNPEYVERRRVNKKKWSRTARLKKQYGLTLEQYENMVLLQNNRCAICNKLGSQFNFKLVIDHCHSTGKVRELLCNRCNTGIGQFYENIEAISKAVVYLKKHKECY